MSDLEALMWTIEKDPFLSSTFGSVTVLDRVPDLARLRNRLLRMVSRIPRLHQKVSHGFGRLAPPEWLDDPEFDIDYHLRHVALPAGSSERDLYDLASRIVADPFDRTRPLWEHTVVEGLPDGRAALIQKMHHTITDGVGGVRMSEQFIDVSRDAPDVEPVTIVASEPPGDSLWGTASQTAGHAVRRTVDLTQRSLGEAGSLARHPGRLVHVPGDVTGTALGTIRQLTPSTHGASPLWRERSLQRRLEVLEVDFDQAYAAAKRLGGSLNDLFVTATAGAAGDYHRMMGAPVATLRMAMPVSTRADRSAAGNAFVPTRVTVPTGIEDPIERFRATHRLLTDARRSQVVGILGSVAGLANLLPTAVLVRFARQQVAGVDFATSNVRAAPFELFIAGASIVATYPIGPLAGTAFNLTLMSYRGRLDMGLNIDTGAVTEPELLREALARAFAELAVAGTST
jgi:WS/DGAT/MGAT family acyltransferase